MCNDITIRKFEYGDIPSKINWINNPDNNKFLHYELPLEFDKTCMWFDKIQSRTDRYDAVIEVDGKAVGLIGLLSIDHKNKKAEYYVAMGEGTYKGKGIATKASALLLDYAFSVLKLEKVYLYTETENVAAQRLFRKIGFREEGILKKDLFIKGKFIDRFVYGITKDEYFPMKDTEITPIQSLGILSQNQLFIKREDLFPYSFGGNKARKGILFFEEIDKGGYDSIVTYGSSHSNHCRIIANMAAERNMPCYIISPVEVSDETFNSRLMKIFGVEITYVTLELVHDTIEEKIKKLQKDGKNPYFIAGGGHSNIGTQAYVDCYEEICLYERINHLHFDYIFFASGTGTTHAGLVCGQLKNKDKREIIGISIARKNPYGRNVVLQSIREYLGSRQVINMNTEEEIQCRTIFTDEYVGDGYGKENKSIDDIVRQVLIQYGIPMDSTYTGKAFWGMEQYIKKEQIRGKKILFIHTGGTPLFFDDLRRL